MKSGHQDYCFTVSKNILGDYISDKKTIDPYLDKIADSIAALDEGGSLRGRFENDFAGPVIRGA